LPAVCRLTAMGVAPVYVAPNAGLPGSGTGAARYSLRPDSFAEAAIRFVEAGACLIAGCCGVGPEHIAAARAALIAAGHFPDC
jgi:5-methyltetrahydrofolate--homocysteine methyltransferase